ncbi:MAG: hypothetical protein LUQ38_03220 [Methanotrichaceae archaeon]|nr:hypothetical protein [Methanotrichaceae archaeon]
MSRFEPKKMVALLFDLSENAPDGVKAGKYWIKVWKPDIPFEPMPTEGKSIASEEAEAYNELWPARKRCLLYIFLVPGSKKYE